MPGKAPATLSRALRIFSAASLSALVLAILGISALSAAAGPAEITIQQVSPTTVELHVATPPNAFTTEVQQSEDLAGWSPVTTITGGGIEVQLQLPVDRPRSFYRAVTQFRPGDLGNLWCVGDSWTDCSAQHTWRRKLSQDLIAKGWIVDFVGTLTTTNPCESGQVFDREHDGVAGITATEVLGSALTNWLATVTPDTVLLLLGGNDLVGGATIPATMTKLGSIMDRMRLNNPNVVIHAGGYAYINDFISDATMDAFNTAMQSLVTAKTTAQSPVYYVDHRVGWSKPVHIDPNDPTHPSVAGMQKLADNWLASIQAHQTTY